jgi:uridine kinase
MLHNDIAQLLPSVSVQALTDEIVQKNIRFVTIAGSSGSGKSSLSNRLMLELSARGHQSVVISLDSFYRVLADIPIDIQTNKPDFDHPDALNHESIKSFFDQLLQQGQAQIPLYSFELNKPLSTSKPVSLQGISTIIIDGLHAFYQPLLPFVYNSTYLKIYVDAFVPQNNELFDFKLFRTIVRDYEVRGRALAQTLQRWHYAKRALSQWILPLVHVDDPQMRVYNSFTLQEFDSLRPRALALLLDALLQAKIDFLQNTALEKSTLNYLDVIATLLRVATISDFAQLLNHL